MDLIVGPRYNTADTRAGGHGTVVLEVNALFATGIQPTIELPVPVAGPIARIELPEGDYRSKQWGRYFAQCLSCLSKGRFYRRKNEPAMFKWAHAHRCEMTARQIRPKSKGWRATNRQEDYVCPNCQGVNGLHSGMDQCPPDPAWVRNLYNG